MKDKLPIGDVGLTRREHEILSYVSDGLTNKAIAGKLQIEKKTVENMLHNIYSKFDLNDGGNRRTSVIKIFYYYQNEQEKIGCCIECAEDQLKVISQVRSRGAPHPAIDAAKLLSDRLTGHLNGKDTSSGVYQKLEQILAKVLIQLSEIYRETCQFSDVARHTLPLTEQLKGIAKRQNNLDMWGVISLIRGDTFYIQGPEHYPEAARLLETALERIQAVGYKVSALRALGIVWSRLENQTGFKKIEAEARELIESEKISKEDTCFLLEGLARGQAQLGDASAFATLDEWRTTFSQMQAQNIDHPIRWIQYARTQLEVLDRLGGKRTLHPSTKEAEVLAETFRYPRLKDQIKKLSSKYL